MKIKTYLGEIHYRPNTIDEYIIKQHKGIPLYFRDFPLAKDDVVLDIGGNIGVTAMYEASVARRVIVCEPEPENFSLLCANTVKFSNVLPLQVFVGSNKFTGEKVPFYLARKTNYAAHSGYIKQGRKEIQVPFMGIGTLCKKYHPTYVKLDCEGAEYDIVPGLVKYKPRAIAMEAHLSAKAFVGKYEPMVQCLEENGYAVFAEHKTGFHSEYYYVNAVQVEEA